MRNSVVCGCVALVGLLGGLVYLGASGVHSARSTTSFVGAAASLSPKPKAASGQYIKAHTRFISDPVTAGRSVGSTGEKLAAKYIAGQLEAYGIEPAGDNGTYYQAVPLRAVIPTSTSALSLVGESLNASLAWKVNFVGSTQGTSKSVSLSNNEVVFVGFGITQKSMGWDDYKGVDVKGKVVLALLGQPKTGKWNGTYYLWNARWNGKLEEASKRGAKAIIFVNTYARSHAYWSAHVANAGSTVVQLPSRLPDTPVDLYGFIPDTAAEALAVAAGTTVSGWFTASEAESFTPSTMPFTASASFSYTFYAFNGTNVVGIQKGTHSPKEAIVLSAHYDSLGTSGTSVYNGAMDNAVSVGILLEAARVTSSLGKLQRSIMYAFTTAEATGIFGAWYFVREYKKTYTLLGDINYWTANTWGLTTDITLIGAPNSTLGTVVLPKACDATNMECYADAMQDWYGYPLYSDNFAFLHEGVPALWLQQGWDYVGHNSTDGFYKWVDTQIWNCYHLPCDKFNEAWVFNGTAQMADVGIEAAVSLARSKYIPKILSSN